MLAGKKGGGKECGGEEEEAGGERMRGRSLAWLASPSTASAPARGPSASHFTQRLCLPMCRANTQLPPCTAIVRFQ